MAENEQCTIRQLRKDEEIEIVAFAQQNISIEEHMQRLNEKIDTFGSDMQWMKSALIEWTQAIEQDERTNELVKKFCMEDEKRANVRNDFIILWTKIFSVAENYEDFFRFYRHLKSNVKLSRKISPNIGNNLSDWLLNECQWDKYWTEQIICMGNCTLNGKI